VSCVLQRLWRAASRHSQLLSSQLFASTLNSIATTSDFPPLCHHTHPLLQLIKGNTFAGTAFSCYGAFWMAFFVTKYIVKTSAGEGEGRTGSLSHPWA
jgi:hypothetical protein